MVFNFGISDIVAILALIVSALSLKKSSEATKVSNNISKGQAEIEIRNMITSAKRYYQEKSLALISDPNNAGLQQLVASALEEVMNTYDEACAKYLDGKVDKERFKETYKDEVFNLITDAGVKSKYEGPQSKYKATVTVYEEWKN
ncbi:MAG: hypothetical protein IJR05_02070 [Acidaminococcaceae bacterium]|nr:hypothetical protein [Acidaminococcaceae bacterium]